MQQNHLYRSVASLLPVSNNLYTLHINRTWSRFPRNQDVPQGWISRVDLCPKEIIDQSSRIANGAGEELCSVSLKNFVVEAIFSRNCKRIYHVRPHRARQC